MAKPPRGTFLGTGEDVPKGHSLRARMLVVEVSRDDINRERLTQCQEAAARGDYAAAMAGFIRWLAPQFDEIQANWKGRVAAARGDLIRNNSGYAHRRTPTLVAELLLGFELFLKFAAEIGAIDQDEKKQLLERCSTAISAVATEQAGHHEAADPCDRFTALLASILSSGRAHLTTLQGGSPEDMKAACGWRPQHRPGESYVEWEPQGRRIGWIDGHDLYLDPDAAFAALRRLAEEQGEPFMVTKDTLHRRLKERRLLASTDEVRKRVLVRRKVDIGRRAVLHLDAGRLGFEIDGPDVPFGPPPDRLPSAGSQGAGLDQAAPPAAPGPEPSDEEGDRGPVGPSGPSLPDVDDLDFDGLDADQESTES
jgi:hypothetical protein